jgi:hypothetical protein
MNEFNEPDQVQNDEQNAPRRGPSLTLVYTLIALAMVAAIAIAAMVVLPFYHRR